MQKNTFGRISLVVALALSVLGIALLYGRNAEKKAEITSPLQATETARQVAAYYPLAESPATGRAIEPRQAIAALPDGKGFAPVIAPVQRASGLMRDVMTEAPPLRPVFPVSFVDVMKLQNATSGLTARPIDANPSTGALAADGSLVYRNAFDDCDVTYRSQKLTAEEFITVHKADAGQKSWSWVLDLKGMSARLTSVGVIELLDRGLPSLRINAPEGKDAAGAVLRYGKELRYELATATDGTTRLTLSADMRGMKFPVVIDPSYKSTVSLVMGRFSHAATLLTDGRLLITGGVATGSVITSTCEIYNPAANGGLGGFTMTATMSTPRTNHRSVLLSGNRVLVIGGLTTGSVATATAEIYDPAANAGAGGWTSTPIMNFARTLHTATVLQDGRVLVAGGTSAQLKAEIFNPGTGLWTPTVDMGFEHKDHIATLLPSGKVLIAGGTNVGGTFTSKSELFDPAGVGSWSTTGDMTTSRNRHQETMLPSGKVLVCGGFNPGFFPSAELYDPTGNSGAGSWGLAASMSRERTEHRATLLANGKTLVAGCHDGSFANTELYDPAGNNGLGVWTSTNNMTTARTEHTATVLQDGRVLVVAGTASGVLATAEIYDPHAEATPQSITVNGSNPTPVALAASTIAAPVTFAVVNNAINGAVTGLDPNLVYTAQDGFSGSDSFTFKANDFFGDSPSAMISVTVNALVPTVTDLTPDAAIAGSSGFTLAVRGTNFVRTTKVRWNGSDRVTTFINRTQLVASISVADVSSPGPISVTVFNPAPGGGLSVASVFTVLGGPAGSWIVSNVNDSGTGSLRFAMKNARASDVITFDATVFDLVNSSAATVINVLSELPAMDKGNVTLDAQNRRVTINGSGAGTSCGIVIASDSNKVMGLNIVGFTKDGICFTSGNSNIIGGNRNLPETGRGPNGQGMRIARCGAFGIQLTGGASSNFIKGCWIGLDASGTKEEANLAGIVMQGGASSNQIGSLVADEANVISGNLFEGVTVSGVGTQDNVILGNIVGASGAVTETATTSGVQSNEVRSRGLGNLRAQIADRSSVSNGNAGVFLSKGTSGTMVGGEGDEGNVVAFNGGNGVEVRAAESRRNASRKNGITRNRGGGIRLFDGSNNGIQGPQFSQVLRIPTLARAGVARMLMAGAAGNGTTSSGTVEIFSDPGTQGQTFVGRATVTNGKFTGEFDVDDKENITATFTDSGSNTSAFTTFGPPPGLNLPVITSALTASGAVGVPVSYTLVASGTGPFTFTAAPLPPGLTLSGDVISGIPTASGTYSVTVSAVNTGGTDTQTLVIFIASAGQMDSDADGVSDALELIAGTDPNDNANAPGNVGVLSVDKAALKLNFVKLTSDTLSTTLRMTMPSDFATSLMQAGVTFGSYSSGSIKLDSKGKGVNTSGTTKLSVKRAQSGSSSIVVTLALKKENIKAQLAADGLIDSGTASAEFTLPVAVAIVTPGRTYARSGEVLVTYKSSKGKSGIGKKSN